MILVDSSVWIDHLNGRDEILGELLYEERIAVHPFVIGELALGNLRRRKTVLSFLQDLPLARVASDNEVLLFIERHELFGLGIGYVDTHLLASTRLTIGTSLWTHDKRLLNIAKSLGLDFGLSH